MFLTGMLAWYDEPVDLLEACIRSCRGFLDRIVAVDGGYELTPGGKPVSPVDQRAAIRVTCKRTGIEPRIFTPQTLWRGQVEKRSFMLGKAVDLGGDFVMPLDADWILNGDPAALRDELAASMADSFVVQFYTPVPHDDPDFDMAQRAAHAWHAELAERTTALPLIYRALPGSRVEKHHWWYSGVKEGHRIGLWGCEGRYPPARIHVVEADFRVDHMCFTRTQETIDPNRAFSAARDLEVQQTGVES